MAQDDRSLLRRVLAAPGFWGCAGLLLHGFWVLVVLSVLSDADFGLHDRLTAWVAANRSPNQGGPDYIIAYGYIGNGVLVIVILAGACNILWMALAIRQHRIEERIKNGLCPACGYHVGTSPICTECGKPVTPKAGPV